MMADIPIRNDAVAAAPSVGKRVFAIAAPDCTLIMAKSTAGIGGMLSSLFFTLLCRYRLVKLQIFLSTFWTKDRIKFIILINSSTKSFKMVLIFISDVTLLLTIK